MARQKNMYHRITRRQESALLRKHDLAKLPAEQQVVMMKSRKEAYDAKESVSPA